MIKMTFLIKLLILHKSQDHRLVEGEGVTEEEEVDIKEAGEVEIIQSHIEGVEIEIFKMDKITEAKEIGMLLALNLEIKESISILIKKLKETIIKKKNFILKNC